MTEGLADHMARHADRDAETIARIVGPEAVAAERRRRAVMLLGNDSPDVAEYRAIMLRRKALNEPERFTADAARPSLPPRSFTACAPISAERSPPRLTLAAGTSRTSRSRMAKPPPQTKDSSMTYDPASPARDDKGRILDVGPSASDEEIAEAIARRDALDAANLAELRRTGRLGNQSILPADSSGWGW